MNPNHLRRLALHLAMAQLVSSPKQIVHVIKPREETVVCTHAELGIEREYNQKHNRKTGQGAIRRQAKQRRRSK